MNLASNSEVTIKKLPKSTLEMKEKRESLQEVILLDDDGKDFSSSSSSTSGATPLQKQKWDNNGKDFSSFSSLFSGVTPSRKRKFEFITVEDLVHTSFEGTSFPRPTPMTVPVPPLDPDFTYLGVHSRFFFHFKIKKKYLLCEIVYMKMYSDFHFKDTWRNSVL